LCFVVFSILKNAFRAAEENNDFKEKIAITHPHLDNADRKGYQIFTLMTTWVKYVCLFNMCVFKKILKTCTDNIKYKTCFVCY